MVEHYGALAHLPLEGKVDTSLHEYIATEYASTSRHAPECNANPPCVQQPVEGQKVCPAYSSAETSSGDPTSSF